MTNYEKTLEDSIKKYAVLGRIGEMLECSKYGFTPLSKITGPGVRGIVYDDTINDEQFLASFGTLIITNYTWEHGQVKEMEVVGPFIDKDVLCRVIKRSSGEYIEIVFKEFYEHAVLIQDGNLLEGTMKGKELKNAYRDIFGFWEAKNKEAELEPGEAFLVSNDLYN